MWGVGAGWALQGLRAAHSPSLLPHPSLPPFLNSLPSSPVPSSGSPAALRQKVSSHLFLKRLRRSLARRCRRLPARPAPADANCCVGACPGGHRGGAGPWPQLRAGYQPLLPAGRVLCQLWGALLVPASLLRLRCEAALVREDAKGPPGPEPFPGGLRAPLLWLLLLSQPSQARVFCQPQVPLAAGQ